MDDAPVLKPSPEPPSPTKSLEDTKKEKYELMESKSEAEPQSVAEEVFEWREVLRGLSICPLQSRSVNDSHFCRHL